MKKSVTVVEKRISFLFQLAHLCITSKDVDKEMCKHHVRNLKRISRKNVIRLHPDIKRRLCKHCDMLLYPGITTKVRLSKKPQRAVTVQCIECKKVRRFPCTNPDYKIWIEKFQDLSQNASWFETEDYLHYTGKANLLWHWISNGRQLSGKVGHSITSPCSYWFHIHCKCTSAEAVTQCVLFIYLEIIFFYMQDTKNIPCNCCNTKWSHFIWYIL